MPDFKGSRTSVEDTVVRAPIDVYNHNIETVPSLYRKCRPGGHYEVSLDVLAHAKQERANLGRGVLTKTGIMLGLGEERSELLRVLNDLRAVDCDILTLGQYLRTLPETTRRWCVMFPQQSSMSSNVTRSRSAFATSRRDRWCEARTTPGARELTAPPYGSGQPSHLITTG